MWGGDDRVIVRGTDSPKIRLRVVGGAGDDVFVDSTRTGGVRFYDDRGRNAAEGSRPFTHQRQALPGVGRQRHQPIPSA